MAAESRMSEAQVAAFYRMIDIATEQLTVSETLDDVQGIDIPAVGKHMSPTHMAKLPVHVFRVVLPYTRSWPLGILYEILKTKTSNVKAKLDILHEFSQFPIDTLEQATIMLVEQYNGHYDALEWLFQNGASPRIKSNRTPLLCLLARRSNSGDAFLLALKYGANARVTSQRKTAFDIATNADRKCPGTGYLEAPTPISVAILEPASVAMCISNGATLTPFTKYTKDAFGRLKEITWAPGADPAHLAAIPKRILTIMQAALSEWRNVWTPTLHKTWPAPFRGYVRFIVMCIRAILPRLPPELVAMIVGHLFGTTNGIYRPGQLDRIYPKRIVL